MANLNSNSVKTTAHEVVSSTAEPLAENTGSDVKKERVGMEISRKEGEQYCGTTMGEASELFSKPIVTPRKFGTKGKDTTYQIGGVLNAIENREVEFKSLTDTQTAPLPWKIMEKAKTFICACLNGDRIGTIYFGVKDSHERGEILGLDVEDAIDDIAKAFQCVLDDHITSDVGPLQMGGEQNCINLEFVPVVNEESRTGLYVIEIEVNRDWKFCKDHVYYCKTWNEKTGGEKKGLHDFYKVKGKYDGVVIRIYGATKHVSEHMDYFHVRKPLMEKYAQWQREAKLG